MGAIIFTVGFAIGSFLNFCIYRIPRKQEIVSPASYPIVQLITGILFMLLYSKFEFSMNFIIYAFILSLLVIIAFIDLDTKIIPDILVVLILIGAIIYEISMILVYNSFGNLLDNIFGLAIGGLLFLIIFVLSKGGIGGGDIKLMAALGFILGVPKILLNIFLSFLLGAIASIILLSLGIRKKKDYIPFGPFIVLSFIITLFWGEEILYWYMVNILN